MRHLVSTARSLAAVFVLTAVAGAAGCATEQKVLKTPYYTISHPDFWQVKSVGAEAGRADRGPIGTYGSTIINEGSGATEGAMLRIVAGRGGGAGVRLARAGRSPENASPTEAGLAAAVQGSRAASSPSTG